MKRTYVIAEAGVNHNGSLEMALQLVDAAARAGADAVKFQTFRTELLAAGGAPKAQYQQRSGSGGETQSEMLRRLELDDDAHRVLIERCGERGITFLSSPFDLVSTELLTGELSLPLLKIASGEITNAPLLLKAAGSGASLILSTGMSTLAEVEEALGVIAHAYTGCGESPSLSSFRRAFASQDGQEALRKKVTLLHCTTEYPAPFAEVNLRAMDTMALAFGLPVGLSDHTPGTAVAIAAVARGAQVVEKHFTLDRSLPGPDHQASLEPDELSLLVAGLRQVESALGSPVKLPAPSEAKNLPIVRKSLVAAGGIAKGERFTTENLAAKRPGTGVSPMRYWEFLGKQADRDYAKDEQI